MTSAQQASMSVTSASGSGTVTGGSILGTITSSGCVTGPEDVRGCPGGLCGGGANVFTPVTGSASVTVSGQTATGGGGSHPNLQPTSFINWMIKL